MKTIKFLAIAIVVALTAGGCYDLDRYPADQLSSGTFFKTQEHADEAMMGVYSTMQYDHVFGLQFSMDCLGGLAMGYDPYAYMPFQQGTYNITNGYVLNKWRYLYEGVARTNVVLQNIDQTNMSDQLKIQYKGEARFMRALFYFTLSDFFGGVPIYDESCVVAEEFASMLKPRDTLADVRRFVLDDLDAAIAAPLPDKWDSSNYGRATLDAAVALKGKVLLYEKRYAEAAACFESVVNSHRHELYPDYAGLFLPGGDESSEMIFAIQNMGGVGQNYGMPMCFYMGTRASYGSCWNNVMASVEFVDSYEKLDGKPFDWDEYIPGFNDSDEVKDAAFRSKFDPASNTVTEYPAAKQTLLKMYSERDPRMNMSIILPYTHYVGWYQNAPHDCEYVIVSGGIPADGHHYIRVNGNRECYLWRKFVPEGNMDGAINNRADTPINFPLIRYADVLLMLAECYNEMDGRQDDAVSLINEVRSRPGVEMPGINSGPAWLEARTHDEIFARIRHERRVELAAEGHNFSDMRRWGLLETLNGRKERYFTGKNWYTRVVSERDYLWPIPSDEQFKNPDLEQNPGW